MSEFSETIDEITRSPTLDEIAKIDQPDHDRNKVDLDLHRSTFLLGFIRLFAAEHPTIFPVVSLLGGEGSVQ